MASGQQAHCIDKTLELEEIALAPIQNNYFCSREKYSAIDHNRKKIKGIKKLSVDDRPNAIARHLATDASLKCSLSNIEQLYREMRDQQRQRPSSSFVRKTDRTNTQRTDRLNVTAASQYLQPGADKVSGADIYRNRYIPDGFKRCRMHKRNRSARLSFCEVANSNRYNQLVAGNKLPNRKSTYEHNVNG